MGVEEKHVGFDSAARAIMTECAPLNVKRIRSQQGHSRLSTQTNSPVTCLTRVASSHPRQSPFSTTATPLSIRFTNSTIPFNLSICAASRSRMFLVRQCTVSALTPVSIILSTSFNVSSCDGNKRILAETEISGGIASRRAFNIEHKRSGLVSRAAPIPACVENGFGHPQLRSTPDTSCITVLAAWTASSGSADPIWYMRYGFSTGCVVKIARETPWYEITPVAAGSGQVGYARMRHSRKSISVL